MFSFHKPKVYRSTSGCCICKAKSSSSRFTDSIKYEDDLTECFKLGEKRTGEICNACVLLVKRFKKLPVGSNRHWRHVVDHRAGPGSKSLGRSKTRNKKRPKLKGDVGSASPGAEDDLSSDLSVLTVISGPNSPTEQPALKSSRKRFRHPEQIVNSRPAHSGLVDFTYWKRLKVCRGVVFVGPCGAVIMDQRYLNDSCSCNRCGPRRTNPSPTVRPAADENRASPISEESRSSPPPLCDEGHPSPPQSDIASGSTTCTAISDSSSDSGYDDCSNPAGAPPAN